MYIFSESCLKMFGASRKWKSTNKKLNGQHTALTTSCFIALMLLYKAADSAFIKYPKKHCLLAIAQIIEIFSQRVATIASKWHRKIPQI